MGTILGLRGRSTSDSTWRKQEPIPGGRAWDASGQSPQWRRVRRNENPSQGDDHGTPSLSGGNLVREHGARSTWSALKRSNKPSQGKYPRTTGKPSMKQEPSQGRRQQEPIPGGRAWDDDYQKCPGEIRLSKQEPIPDGLFLGLESLVCSYPKGKILGLPLVLEPLLWAPSADTSRRSNAEAKPIPGV
jgi:hypothetical protein